MLKLELLQLIYKKDFHFPDNVYLPSKKQAGSFSSRTWLHVYEL